MLNSSSKGIVFATVVQKSHSDIFKLIFEALLIDWNGFSMQMQMKMGI